MFIAKLYIGEEEFDVLEYSVTISKGVDGTNRVSTTFRDGVYYFVIESTGSTTIYGLTINATQKEDVILVIFSRDGKSTSYKLGDSYFIEYTMGFSATGNQPAKDSFIVSPGYVERNGILMFKKNWGKPDLANNVKPTIINKEEEQFIENYFEDLQGNRIENLKVGTEVYLVIRTESATGKSIDIDLSDKKKDFVYKDQILENDILKNILIKSDTQKEKLTIIAQNK